MSSEPADPAAPTPVDRGSWPVRVYRLGAEPSDDLSATSTPEERLAMMEPLALEAFALSGRPLPTYGRAESPVSLRRLGE
jgi:hypothetical protein